MSCPYYNALFEELSFKLFTRCYFIFSAVVIFTLYMLTIAEVLFVL